LDNFIEKYKIHLGLFLGLTIVFGGIILLSQKNILSELNEKMQSEEEIQVHNYEIENQDLKEKIAQLEEQIKILEEEKNTVSQEKESSTQGKININTADLSDLTVLSGIGPAKAQAIIDYRTLQNGFKNINEIQNVKGIGPKTFENIKNQISVD